MKIKDIYVSHKMLNKFFKSLVSKITKYIKSIFSSDSKFRVSEVIYFSPKGTLQMVILFTTVTLSKNVKIIEIGLNQMIQIV
jgi:hypothetical protein